MRLKYEHDEIYMTVSMYKGKKYDGYLSCQGSSDNVMCSLARFCPNITIDDRKTSNGQLKEAFRDMSLSERTSFTQGLQLL